MAKPGDIAPIEMTLEVVQTARLQTFCASHNGIVSHELGLHKATAGMFTARRVKTAGNWPLEAIASQDGAWLTFIYVLAGTIELRLDDRLITLHAHDAISQVPLTAENVVGASPALEFFELQARDDPRIRDFIPKVPRQLICVEAPELHVKGQGPRDFFDYRDLGLADITDGRMEIQVIRAQKPRQARA